MSSLGNVLSNQEYEELYLGCSRFLVAQSSDCVAHFPTDVERKIFEQALQKKNFRRLRLGLTSDDLKDRNAELVAAELAGLLEHSDVFQDDDLDAVTIGGAEGEEFLSPLADTQNLADDLRILSNAYPHIYEEYHDRPLYLFARSPRGALFDALELEITKYIDDCKHYPEEDQNDSLRTVTMQDKMEMAERVIHLLHSVGEVIYTNNLKAFHAESHPDPKVIGYGPRTDKAARDKTTTQMKALLTSDEHINLEGEKESISGLLTRKLGQAIFKGSLLSVYKNQNYLDSSDFLNILRGEPSRSSSK